MATCPKCHRHYPDELTHCEADGTDLVPDSVFAASEMLEAGSSVGEYRIEGLLGKGGFGMVYQAVHPVIGKAAAVKVLNREYSSSPEMVSRFLAEARAVNQIRHKNIVDIFSFGALPDGRQYYVMELLDGMPLDRFVAERGRLTVEQTLGVLRGVARALDAAHANGIVHRDLKPANIFIAFDEDGGLFPKLLDFGIAKLFANAAGGGPKTQTGAPMGTPYYMSPEQCRGSGVDHRTDVYAFGVMAFELLTGSLPFDDESHLDLMVRHVSDTPPRPSERVDGLDPSFDAPILRMLEKHPEKRPGSASEAYAGLAGVAAALGYRVDTRGATSSGKGDPAPRLGAVRSELQQAPTVADPASGQQTLGAQTLPGGRPRRPAAAAALAVIVVALGAGGAVLMLKEPGGAEPDTSIAADQPPAASITASPPAPTVSSFPPEAPEPEPEPSAPAEPATVELTVQSSPAGVEVFVGDEKLGVAPGPIRLDRGDQAITLTFKAKGHRFEQVTLTPTKDTVVSVALRKAVQRKRPRRKAKPRVLDELEF